MDSTRQLLLIGSDPGCIATLREHACEIVQVDSLEAALERHGSAPFDAVLLNLAPPGPSVAEALARLQASAPELPVIVLSHPEAEEAALATLPLGAQDYCLVPGSDPRCLITAVRKAMARQRRQGMSARDQRMLEWLMDKIPDAIYFKDVQSRFLRISRAQARQFGLSDPSEAIGQTDADFFIGEHARQALEDETRIMRTGQPMVGMEEMETWPDGTVSWVSTTKMALRDPSGKIIGTFGISRNITERKDAELALAERTRQLHLRNQQMEEELKMARELQIAMLPQVFPGFGQKGSRDGALKFFSYFLPSGLVSGDFYDVIELSDSAVGLFICDVMGHDVRAALVTAMMRALVEDLSHLAADPGQLLTQINRGLAGIFKQTDTTMFATAFYAVADLAAGEMRFASAAHPEPLHLVRREGLVQTLHAGPRDKGPALGLFENAVYPSSRRPISGGDLVLLFTDGLTDAEGLDEESFTQERLAAAVRRRLHDPAEKLCAALIDEVREFCGGAPLGDDASLLGMEIKRLRNGG